MYTAIVEWSVYSACVVGWLNRIEREYMEWNGMECQVSLSVEAGGGGSNRREGAHELDDHVLDNLAEARLHAIAPERRVDVRGELRDHLRVRLALERVPAPLLRTHSHSHSHTITFTFTFTFAHCRFKFTRAKRTPKHELLCNSLIISIAIETYVICTVTVEYVK